MNYERRKQGNEPAVVIGIDSSGFGCTEILVQKSYKTSIFESKPAKIYGREN
jgi:hypothetical protein